MHTNRKNPREIFQFIEKFRVSKSGRYFSFLEKIPPKIDKKAPLAQICTSKDKFLPKIGQKSSFMTIFGRKKGTMSTSFRQSVKNRPTFSLFYDKKFCQKRSRAPYARAQKLIFLIFGRSSRVGPYQKPPKFLFFGANSVRHLKHPKVYIIIVPGPKTCSDRQNEMFICHIWRQKCRA